MTDTKRRFREQMENPEARAVTEALVNANKVHPPLATCCGGAAGLSCFSLGALTWAALRPTAIQYEIEMVACGPSFCDPVLRHDTAIVFNIDLQFRAGQDVLAELQDFGETIGTKPMLTVVADVSLQNHLFLFAGHSTAIDEIFYDMPNFGDVRLGRDIVTIRQNESRKAIGVILE